MTIAPHHRIYTCFFLFAISLGALLARMPDLQVALGVNKSELGLTLIGMAIGALISLTLSSPLIAHLGARTTAFITVLGTAVAFAIVPWLGAAPAVFCVLFCAGLLAGALEINLNVEIDRLEAQLGRGIMNRAHGFWSLGFFVTALIASVVRQADISMHVHLGVTLVLVIIIGMVAISGIRPAPARAIVEEAKAPMFALPTLGLLPLCIIGLAAFLVEGAGIDWSAIYMRDVFAVEPFIGGLGLTLFTFFMAMARLFVDPIVDRFGARAVATALLILSAIGLTAVWLAPHPYIALFGFALMGGGCSAVYPLAVSAAAQRTDRPAQVNVAALGQVTFIVFFLAPPLLGFVAEHFGIRISYLVCLPLILYALFSVKALAPKRQVGPVVSPSMPGADHLPI
ncbi:MULTISPECIES: MFS transporter [unclassified Rhizobium]|uniref:MFS transporter n=1 Tax=unclassified Rhizobium TaxID=2613769 RepID=UPI0007149E11|nr:MULTISPECIES: MFS transporter [unclassified Rhizobium]KQS99101.1 MFS transporter [Rhizobium sp. Leaf386]KQT05425.1 MFS transporter [Rhizobium sp. Leaf391]KQT91867.1 MFS transporter [Rhizobium sp. Leaf453]